MTQILQTSPPVFPNSKSPTAIIDEADSEAMAILNYNKPSAYLVPTLLYEKMLEIVDDYYLTQEDTTTSTKSNSEAPAIA